MKPIIGITTYDDKKQDIHRVNNDYVYAVMKAGGLVLNIPTIRDLDDIGQYLDIVDGLVFTGGADLSPLYYGENPRKEISEVSNKRDEYEMALFEEAYDRKIPILGICRGMQLGNVVLNGSLHQDIFKEVPNVLGHAPKEVMVDELYHSIKIREDSMMEDIFKEEEILVNSLHHQAIKDVGNDLMISSISSDGIIESIESIDDRFFLGVQFHPEALQERYPEFLGVFKKLIEVCSDKK